MANTAGPLIPEYWSPMLQPYLMKSLVGLEICDTSLEANLKQGDTVHKPYFTEGSAVAYTPGSAITIQDWSSTDEYLTADQKYVVPHYIDDVNALQMAYDVQSELAERSAYLLRDKIDQDILAEYANANDTLDDGKSTKIAVNKFGYMLETLVRLLVGGLNPLTI